MTKYEQLYRQGNLKQAQIESMQRAYMQRDEDYPSIETIVEFERRRAFIEGLLGFLVCDDDTPLLTEEGLKFIESQIEEA